MNKHLVWTECSRCKHSAIECCDIEGKPVCHLCYGDTHDCFLERCLEIYEKDGQDGVFDEALKHPFFIKWAYCDPCEIESPVWKSVCAVCWTPIETKG